ncbi:MAG: nitrogen regulation protein NR(II) [Nitrospirota bacterium]
MLTNRGAFRIRGVVILLIVILLIILVLHYRLLLNLTKRYLRENIEERLVAGSVSIIPEIENNFERAMNDPYYLYAIGEQYSVDRISIFDNEGLLLSDSSGTGDVKKIASMIGIPLSGIDNLREDEHLISPVYADEIGKSMISIFLLLQKDPSPEKKIIRISLDVTNIMEEEKGLTSSLLIKSLLSTTLSLFIYYIARYTVTYQRNRLRSTSGEGLFENEDKTGFVIDTFHTLFRGLKEKEEELEKLKTKAEDKASEIESYNENILRSVTTGVITFNREREITTFNYAAERILGISREGAVGKMCGELFGDESMFCRILKRSLEEDEETAIARDEFELQKKNGERIWIGLSASLLKNREDEIIGTILIFTDLTDVRRLQEQLELRKRLSMIGEMSAGIAHEFRNFMGTILGFGRLLSKKTEKDDPRQEMIKAIIDELNAMGNMIDDLLKFGKDAVLEPKSTDLNRLIKKILMQSMGKAKEPKPMLSLNIPQDIPMVYIDEGLINQAITNLIKNSLEAMPERGELKIEVRYKTPDKEKAYRDSKENGFVELIISDTGIGIPDDKLEKIFLPFFTTKEKGTGLGLAMANKIILSHNGIIEVESRERAGTRFRISLPIQRGE